MADQITQQQADQLQRKIDEEMNVLKNVPNSVLNDVTVNDAELDELKKHTVGTDGGTVKNDSSGTVQQPLPPYSTVENGGNGGGKKKVDLSKLISGSKAVDLVDFIVPALFVKVIENTTGKNIDAKELKASKDEKEILVPLVNDFMASINLELTPTTALLICLGFIYGTKAVELSNKPGTGKSEEIKPGETKTDPQKKQNRPGTFSSTNQPLRRKRK